MRGIIKTYLKYLDWTNEDYEKNQDLFDSYDHNDWHTCLLDVIENIDSIEQVDYFLKKNKKLQNSFELVHGQSEHKTIYIQLIELLEEQKERLMSKTKQDEIQKTGHKEIEPIRWRGNYFQLYRLLELLKDHKLIE